MTRPLSKVHIVYVLVDLVAIGFCFYFSYFLYHLKYAPGSAAQFYPPYFKQYSVAFIIWAIFIVISLKRNDLYFTDRGLTIPKEAQQVFLGISYSSILMGAAIFFTQYKFFTYSRTGT